VGCLHCQRVCPENKELLAWVEEGAGFSSEETRLLFEGVPLNQLPAATVRKLEQWDLTDLLDVLPRNLKVFFERVRNNEGPTSVFGPIGRDPCRDVATPG
jgi:epoxyqueuosine reductase